MNKTSGNPTCPSAVRREKTITQSITVRAHAASLRREHLSEDEREGVVYRRKRIEERVNHRSPGAGGVRNITRCYSTYDALIDCVTQFSDKFSAMSDAIVGPSTSNTEEVFQDEVQRALSSLMSVIKSLIESLRN